MPQTSIYITDSLKHKIEQESEKRRLSISKTIQVLLLEYFDFVDGSNNEVSMTDFNKLVKEVNDLKQLVKGMLKLNE